VDKSVDDIVKTHSTPYKSGVFIKLAIF